MTAGLRIRSSSPADDAAQLGRRVRDLAIDGSTQIARRADVPHLVEVGRDTAAAAVSDAVDRVTGRRRRRRSSLGSAALVAFLLMLGLGTWWFVRNSASIAALRAIHEDEAMDEDLGEVVDRAIEADALSRATDEGMGVAQGPTDQAPIPVPPEGGPADAADRVGELTHS